MKKIIYLVVTLVVATALFGCTPTNKQEPIIEFEVALTVEGLETRTLTEVDFNQMTFVEATISRTGRDGAELVYQVKGILMKELLAYLNVEPTSVYLEAADGYNQVYDQEIFNDELTIVAFFNDGEILPQEDGPIWVLAGNATSNFWIRQLKLLKIE